MEIAVPGLPLTLISPTRGEKINGFFPRPRLPSGQVLHWNQHDVKTGYFQQRGAVAGFINPLLLPL